MKAVDLLPWLSLGAAILAAGLWLGRNDQSDRDMERRITNLEAQQHYLHGTITVPREP